MPSRRTKKPKKPTTAQIIRALEDDRPRPNEFGYVRVSTEEQNSEMQRRALIEAGLQDRAIFEDVMSGKTMNRPAWERMNRFLRDGDTVVVWKLDRFGRSLQGVLNTLAELDERGIKIRSVTESIDTSSPWGRAMMAIILVFAQMERELISERTKRGIENYKAKGGRMGRKHSVLDVPKRLEAFHDLYDSGEVFGMEGQEFIDAMNKADPDATPIKSPQMFYQWKAKDFKGYTPRVVDDV